MATYSEKLRDPRWQRKRLEILQREDFTCEACHRQDRTLHVHHGYYESGYDPWDYDSNTMHCLCESCHQEVSSATLEVYIAIAQMHPFRFALLWRDLCLKPRWREKQQKN